MVKPRALTQEEHAYLAREIRDAEAASSGEIYVVVAQAPDEFRLVPVLWAALFALVLAWALFLATTLSTSLILTFQALGFVATAVIFSVPAVRRRTVPSKIAEEAVHRAALAQFMAHGVHLTSARTGVLIYVSLFPRRIEVLADEGIHAKVSQGVWDEAVAEIAAHARAGKLRDGLANAIRSMGALLTAHFPRASEDRNELADRVVEL